MWSFSVSQNYSFKNRYLLGGVAVLLLVKFHFLSFPKDWALNFISIHGAWMNNLSTAMWCWVKEPTTLIKKFFWNYTCHWARQYICLNCQNDMVNLFLFLSVMHWSMYLDQIRQICFGKCEITENITRI